MLSVDIKLRLGGIALDVAFETDGGCTALFGSSGAGKSLTLKCIAGIVRPDSGRIVLNDTVLFDSDRRINLPPQKRQVGYLFQDYALFPNMTVRGNILAGLHRLPRSQRNKIADELIGQFRLEGLEQSRPSTLSGGEKQRVALARIFASAPTLLLLDEPFSSLDSLLSWQLEQELSRMLCEQQLETLLVSHDVSEVCRMSRAAVPITNGKSEPKQDIITFYNSIKEKSSVAGIPFYLDPPTEEAPHD